MNRNKETKETVDSVLLSVAEEKDIMTLKIVRKRPFKQSNEATGLRNFALSTKL